MNQIYTVKETAKILGFSTNTVYKYLNEGRLKAARGGLEQGRFRIPHQSIEEFLGTEIPADILLHLKYQSTEPEMSINTPLAYTAPTPPTLPIATARIMIVCALLAVITDIVIAPTISLFGQIARIGVIGICILVSYQSFTPREKHDATTQPTSHLEQV